MKIYEKKEKKEKITKNKLCIDNCFKSVKLKNFDNIALGESSPNKSVMILSHKSPNNKGNSFKNKNNYNNNIRLLYNLSNSNQKKNKTLNNTFHKRNKSLNIKNSSAKTKKISNKSKNSEFLKTIFKPKNPVKLKLLEGGMHSPNYKNKSKDKQINYLKKDKNRYRNISSGVNNIEVFNKSNEHPSFYSNYKNIINKTPKNNINIKNYQLKTHIKNIGFKTYNEKKMHKNYSFILSNISKNSKDKNKKNSVKEKYSFLKRNNSYNYRKRETKSNNIKSNNQKNKTMHKKKINEDNINSFTNNLSYKNNNTDFSMTLNSYNKKILLNELSSKKKPRVDSLEYLAKIMNSININNFLDSIAKKNELNSINYKNNKNLNIFRKKIEKNKNKENNDIKKYIKVKKKLYKLSNIKTKKKEKEVKLKKYLQLYKLQENISNSKINNTFYHTSSKFSKTQNIPNINKDNKNISNKNNNINNEYLSSIDSTIVDKNNFYKGIIDIQNIYSNNIIHNKIIINNYSNYENDKKNNKIENNNNLDFNYNENKINNSRNLEDLDNNLNNQFQFYNNNNENIKEENNINANEKKMINYEYQVSKFNNELKEEKIDEINFIHFSPNKKELNKENENIEIKNSEKKKEFLIKDIKEYSFSKLNDSESNENNDLNMNSISTSKFCNSQLNLEEKQENQNNININKEKEEEKEKEKIENNNDILNQQNNINNIPSIRLPPTLQTISDHNSLRENKKNYNFTNEELNNYREILNSLFDYLKLITQRNALNDIISYGDMKYKYKIGFEIILNLIKLAPFNIIRAIQQSQYYHFAFRQLFIPYIARSFSQLKIYCSYDKIFRTFEEKIIFIYKKIFIKKLEYFYKNKKEMNDNNDILDININPINNSNITIKSLEEITELINNDNNERKDMQSSSKIDISQSKENDIIEWENSFFSDKQINDKENNHINIKINKIDNDKNFGSKDFNLSIPDIISEDQK